MAPDSKPGPSSKHGLVCVRIGSSQTVQGPKARAGWVLRGPGPPDLPACETGCPRKQGPPVDSGPYSGVVVMSRVVYQRGGGDAVHVVVRCLGSDVRYSFG